ncbi:MAG TPA: hypothetical protein VGL82_12120 [Bryobacteraceae bacterium]|jgi:hypothetical protein
MGKRLAAAMGAYAVLIAIAVYLLHGKVILLFDRTVPLLYPLLLLFAALILKTLIAVRAGWLYRSGTDASESDSKSDQTGFSDPPAER